MSIASEISRLQGAKTDIKDAIEAKGVTVPSSAKLDTYDTYIAQIGGGTQGHELLVTYRDVVTVTDPQTGVSHSEVTYTEGSITLPQGQTYILNSTIPNADKPRVVKVTIPDSVNELRSGCFINVSFYSGNSPFPNLASIEGLENITTLTGNAQFYGTRISRHLYLPSLSTATGDEQFADSLLIGIDSLGHLTQIKNYMFAYCQYLQTAILPIVVTTIGNFAFNENTRLKSVNFSELSALTSISSKAFQNCSALVLDSGLPSSLTTIGDSAFEGCSSLGCSLNLPNLTSIGAAAFKSSSITTVQNLGSITALSDETFRNCAALTTATLPSTLTAIGDYCFAGVSSGTAAQFSHLATVTMSNSLVSIGNYAFDYCKELTSISFPSTTTTIGNYAFRGCSKLASITFSSGLTSIGNYAFQSTAPVTINLSATQGNSLNIGDYGFSNISAARTITLPTDAVIKQFAFSTMGGQTYDADIASALSFNLNLSNSSMTSVPACAFYRSLLTKITSLGSVTTIAAASSSKGVFEGSSYLTEATLPATLTSLGTRAFYNCTHLTTLYSLATTPPTFGSNALYGTTALEHIYVPTDSVAAYKAKSGWSSFSAKIEAIPT